MARIPVCALALLLAAGCAGTDDGPADASTTTSTVTSATPPTSTTPSATTTQAPSQFPLYLNGTANTAGGCADPVPTLDPSDSNLHEVPPEAWNHSFEGPIEASGFHGDLCVYWLGAEGNVVGRDGETVPYQATHGFVQATAAALVQYSVRID